MNTPCFTKPPSLKLFLALLISIPTLYYLSVALTQNRFIAVFQVLFFLIPAVILTRSFEIHNAYQKTYVITKLAVTILVSLLTTFALNSLLSLWSEIFPIPLELEKAMQDLLSLNQKYGFFVDLVLIAAIPAVCEEYFFRAVIQTGFYNWMGPKMAIFGASLIFALYHINPWFFPFYLILGLVFGWIYHKTQNIWFAVLAHFINNAYGVLMFHVYGFGGT